MKLFQLLADLDAQIPVSAMEYDVTGLSHDSRHVMQGDVFCALQGSQQHGRQFIEHAIAQGARVILTSTLLPSSPSQPIPICFVPNLEGQLSLIAGRFFGQPADKLYIIGATGTSGKTSCTHFVAEALHHLQQPCGIIGTLGNGPYGALQPSGLTTPDAISVQRILAEYVTQKIAYVAMEASSHALSQGRVAAIPFAVGIFTGLSREHLDYHGTMAAYGAAKAKLFDQTRVAVIHAADPFGHKLINTIPDQDIIAYSITPVANLPARARYVFAHEVVSEAGHLRCALETPWGAGTFAVSLAGTFNLANALAALSALCALGFPFDEVKQAIAKLSSVPGRMQTFGGGRLPRVIVDYAHKPDALEKVLQALRPHCAGRLYCVFGCGGGRDRGKRQLMAEIAERLSDHVIITDDNPRMEDPATIVADILSGFTAQHAVTVEHNRFKAIQHALQSAQAEDCVLIAGKGAEAYQLIGNQQLPFSDADVVQLLLAEKLGVVDN